MRREVRARDESRNDETGKLRRTTDIVHRDNVGMLQTSNGAGFNQIEFRILRARDEFGVWDFDSDRPIECFILR